MDGFETTRLYSIFVDGARRVHPRQFGDIARKSALVFGSAKAKHARARLGLHRAFRCCDFGKLNKFAVGDSDELMAEEFLRVF